MERLRQRFIPQFKEGNLDLDPDVGTEGERDYFGFPTTKDSPGTLDVPRASGGRATSSGSSASATTTRDLKTPRPKPTVLPPNRQSGSPSFMANSNASGFSMARKGRSGTSLSMSTAFDSPVGGMFRRRSQVNAGDLLTMTGGTSPTTAFHSFPLSRSTGRLASTHHLGRPSLAASGLRMSSTAAAPIITVSGGRQSAPGSPEETRRVASSKQTTGTNAASDFDLKEGVMDCFAKSIGLIQPPMSNLLSSGTTGNLSAESSPMLNATDPSNIYQSFSTSFGSLSFLSTGTGMDDASSVAGSSIIGIGGATYGGPGGYGEGIDNEVEILFFKSGDTLVHAGERNAGEFTEGFVGKDIRLSHSILQECSLSLKDSWMSLYRLRMTSSRRPLQQ